MPDEPEASRPSITSRDLHQYPTGEDIKVRAILLACAPHEATRSWTLNRDTMMPFQTGSLLSCTVPGGAGSLRTKRKQVSRDGLNRARVFERVWMPPSAGSPHE